MVRLPVNARGQVLGEHVRGVGEASRQLRRPRLRPQRIAGHQRHQAPDQGVGEACCAGRHPGRPPARRRQLDQKQHQGRQEDRKHPVAAKDRIGEDGGQDRDAQHQQRRVRDQDDDAEAQHHADHRAQPPQQPAHEHGAEVGLEDQGDGHHDPVGAGDGKDLLQDLGDRHAEDEADHEQPGAAAGEDLVRHRVKALPERGRPGRDRGAVPAGPDSRVRPPPGVEERLRRRVRLHRGSRPLGPDPHRQRHRGLGESRRGWLTGVGDRDRGLDQRRGRVKQCPQSQDRPVPPTGAGARAEHRVEGVVEGFREGEASPFHVRGAGGGQELADALEDERH